MHSHNTLTLNQLKFDHNVTESSNSQLKQRLNEALESIHCLEVKNDVLQRENVEARNELADARLKLEV